MSGPATLRLKQKRKHDAAAKRRTADRGHQAAIDMAMLNNFIALETQHLPQRFSSQAEYDELVSAAYARAFARLEQYRAERAAP